MTKISVEEISQKWAPIIESMGITGSKADWFSQYAEISSNESYPDPVITQSQPLLPIIRQVGRLSSKTISLDLVTVKPIGGGNSGCELKKIRKDIKIENRDRMIDSVIMDKEFEEMKVEDHPNYIKSKGPNFELFYMDYKYGSTQSKNK